MPGMMHSVCAAASQIAPCHLIRESVSAVGLEQNQQRLPFAWQQATFHLQINPTHEVGECSRCSEFRFANEFPCMGGSVVLQASKTRTNNFWCDALMFNGSFCFGPGIALFSTPVLKLGLWQRGSELQGPLSTCICW